MPAKTAGVTPGTAAVQAKLAPIVVNANPIITAPKAIRPQPPPAPTRTGVM